MPEEEVEEQHITLEEAIKRAESAFDVMERAISVTRKEYINGLKELEESVQLKPEDVTAIICNTAGELTRLSRLAELLDRSMLPFLYTLMFYWTSGQQQFEEEKKKITTFAAAMKSNPDDTDLYVPCPGDQICPIE